jgi:hypothetical protein
MATITADGSVTLTLFTGRIYTIAAGGDFGGGSLAASLLLDDDTPVPITGFPITGGAIVNFSAGATRLRLTLTGSTDPEISYAVTPAGAEASADTLTNKRIPPRITTITSSATPAVNTDLCDMVTITALAVAITSMTSGLTGTPSNGEMLLYRIKDDGTARAITWGASFAAAGASLPTTTVLGKILHVLFIWDSVTSKWCCLSTAQEA